MTWGVKGEESADPLVLPESAKKKEKKRVAVPVCQH